MSTATRGTTTGRSLEGRSIIITGAAQGIGATFARALALQGASIGIIDVRSPDETVAAIRSGGARAIGTMGDVTNGRSVRQFVESVREAFGGVQGLVNNAALFADLPKRPLTEVSSEEFDRVMQVNVRGAFECAKAVVPVMEKQGYGKIVNITSGTVFKGQVMMLPYVTSKGALIAMARCLAREFGHAGVRANCLAPGFTLSEGVLQQDEWLRAGQATVASRCLRRDQTPEDLVGALVYLLSASSDFMTGQTMVVDGGSVMH